MNIWRTKHMYWSTKFRYCISGTDTCSTCWAHTYLKLWTSYLATRITNTAQWSMLAWSLTQGLNTVCFNVFRTKIIHLQQYEACDTKLPLYIQRENNPQSNFHYYRLDQQHCKLHFAQDYPYKLYCFIILLKMELLRMSFLTVTLLHSAASTWPNWIRHLHACCTGVDQMVQWTF